MVTGAMMTNQDSVGAQLKTSTHSATPAELAPAMKSWTTANRSPCFATGAWLRNVNRLFQKKLQATPAV
jgi:hypothetical protein